MNDNIFDMTASTETNYHIVSNGIDIIVDLNKIEHTVKVCSEYFHIWYYPGEAAYGWIF